MKIEIDLTKQLKQYLDTTFPKYNYQKEFICPNCNNNVTTCDTCGKYFKSNETG